MKIILEEKKCIGCGSCAALDPKNFKMTEDNSKAHLVEGNVDDEKVWSKETEITDDTKDATDSCPVMCIHLKEDTA